MALVDAALHMTECKEPSLDGKGPCSEPVVHDHDELLSATLGRGSIGTLTSPSRLATDSGMRSSNVGGIGRGDGEFSADEYSKDNDVFRDSVGVGEQNGGRELQAW